MSPAAVRRVHASGDRVARLRVMAREIPLDAMNRLLSQTLDEQTRA